MSYSYCYYRQDRNGYISGCDYRAAFNRHWKWCPYCGKRISRMLCEFEDENKKGE